MKLLQRSKERRQFLMKHVMDDVIPKDAVSGMLAMSCESSASLNDDITMKIAESVAEAEEDEAALLSLIDSEVSEQQSKPLREDSSAEETDAQSQEAAAAAEDTTTLLSPVPLSPVVDSEELSDFAYSDEDDCANPIGLIIAEGSKMHRSDQLWRLTLKSGLARLAGGEYRVHEWKVKMSSDLL
uniref:Uncharacterized protein n=1 Tax=Octactis speculum TaxID=3111310 RepID=A0A7S2GV05_9STRA